MSNVRQRDTQVAVQADSYGLSMSCQLDMDWTYAAGTLTAASLVAPGQNTHSLDMGQKVVFLEVVANIAPADPGGQGSATVKMPPTAARVINPGWV